MTIVATLSISSPSDFAAHKTTEAPRYGRDAQGYGRRIPTQHMVKLHGSSRWRRVYVCQISNAGTAYVEQGDDWIVVED